MLGAGNVELGHLGGGGHVSDGLDGGDDEGQDAGEDERRVDRQRIGEHPQEGDALGCTPRKRAEAERERGGGKIVDRAQ